MRTVSSNWRTILAGNSTCMTSTKVDSNLNQYLVITGSYWAFTLTDGALRMLVILHFHQIGYTPLEIALLFLFYEFSGIITNLIAGWLGARIGLNSVLNIGLILQFIALSMLLVPTEMLGLVWVMCAQALSGIAKDLNKTGAKSSVKLFVGDGESSRLYRWVAALTGSKNVMKGLGFFAGGLLLALLEFQGAVLALLLPIFLAILVSLVLLRKELGKAEHKAKFKDTFSTSVSVNRLSAARFFLFGSRDVWFVIALPVYLSESLNWSHWEVGTFMALWVIGYGLVQALSPKITKNVDSNHPVTQLANWGLLLAIIPTLIATGLSSNLEPRLILILGLLIFGVVFAINSALHSYLIVECARHEGVSLDVGFYYMANAGGRLVGTLLSGWVFQAYGLVACLWVSGLFLFITAAISILIPSQDIPDSHSN